MQTRRIKLWAQILLAGLLSAFQAFSQTNVQQPFLADEFSVFNFAGSDSAARNFNFTLPSGPAAYPTLTSYFAPSLTPGDFLALNPNSTEEMSADVAYASSIGAWTSQAMSDAFYMMPCPPDSPATGAAAIGVECDMGMYIMTQDNLMDELTNRIEPQVGNALFPYSIQEINLDYIISGGPFNNKEVQLHGEMAYGFGLDTNNDPTTQEAWDGNMLIALNWGIDPLGNTNYVLINLTLTASAQTDDPMCLPVDDVCEHFYNSMTVSGYFNIAWQELMSEVGNGKMYFTGAVPELLYLYDYSGRYTLPPASTMPPHTLDDAAVLDLTNQDYPGYTNVYAIANQYDAGNHYGIPVRFSKAGGNACGPTSLGMMLNAYPVSPVNPITDFDNTTILGYYVPANTKNGFTWGGRALEWLSGQAAAKGQVAFSAPSPLPKGAPVWQKEVTGTNLTDASITGMWKNINRLLYNGQPVEVRTDLGSGKSPGGGHCILLLGISFNPDLPTLYGGSVSGNYYIAADPAGHYFGNSSGSHYDTFENLTDLDVGINYGGWFAIYPMELLQQRISDTSTNITYRYRMEALTLGDPIVVPTAHASAHSPVAMMVTDPIGRQTGVMPNGTIVANIPSSYYVQAAVDEEEQGTSSVDPNGPKTVDIDNPMDGIYEAQLTGTNTGSYELDWIPVNSGNSIVGTVTNLGTTSLGQQNNYYFNLGLGSTPSLQFMTSNNALALFWPTNTAGYLIQSSTNISSLANWKTISGPFFQTNGVNALTNVMSGVPHFYRLDNP